MDMRRLDLNLLTVLHVLLEEAHVSRAARRLAMSQPATSSALDRCRHLFGDPLLERAGNSMRPTAKADALRQPLAEIIDQIGRLVAVEAPALEDLRQAVHIMVADGFAAAMVGLRQAVNDRVPGISLVLHPWGGGALALQALARGTVDLAVSVLPQPMDASIHAEAVAKVDYRVVMRRDHPAAQNFDLKRWLAWPHIIVSAEGATRTPIDEALADLGLERQVGMVLPSFLLVPEIVRHSQMVALLPAIAVDVDGSDLIALRPPLAIQGFTLHLAWHRRHDHDRAVQFVASEVRRVLHISNDEVGPP